MLHRTFYGSSDLLTGDKGSWYCGFMFLDYYHKTWHSEMKAKRMLKLEGMWWRALVSGCAHSVIRSRGISGFSLWSGNNFSGQTVGVYVKTKKNIGQSGEEKMCKHWEETKEFWLVEMVFFVLVRPLLLMSLCAMVLVLPAPESTLGILAHCMSAARLGNESEVQG